MLKRFFATIVFISILVSSYAQKDPVLFSVEDTPVNLSEFEYIYSKTNGKKADFSRASLQEYLDLYKKFKLKVKRAKDMQLDTIPSLQQELAGYRQQLANSYLTDKEVTDRLVKELYDRSQKDVDMSHIMVKINGLPNPSPSDTLIAYNKAMDLMKKINAGASFEEIAKTSSIDPSAKTNGGRLGFLTAPLPKGFYNLETAIYSLKKGKMSGPVRTDAGYHIVKVHGSRVARGEVEAGHILIRTSGKTDQDLKTKNLIDSLYKALTAGADFETLAKTHSQDKATASKGGYIGFFGINRYDRAFEDAAFKLSKDGEFSQPVKSKVGWHIVRRVSKKTDEKYDLAKRRLENKIKKDTRFELAKKSMINRIQKESGFQENEKALNTFIGSLGEDFLTHKWKSPSQSEEALISFTSSDQSFSVQDFAKYCQKSSRKRIRGKGVKGKTAASVAKELYSDYVMESTLSYEETQLEKKYPEFRFLMREYEEGILLFEATKLLVWDKASQDSVGLKSYFDKNRENFMWKKRAEVTVFTVKQEGQKQLAKIRKFAKKNEPQAVLDKFNTSDNIIIDFTNKTLEEGKDAMLDGITWTAGQITDSEINNRNKSSNFTKINKVLLPAPKTLKESRGYVIADYQDFLEKEWIKELEAAYKIKVNNKVFEKMVKK